MGTRNLTCVVKGGKFKIAQYGQWDGYPTGQGATVCEFIRKRLQCPKGRRAFETALDSVRFIDQDRCDELWAAERLPESHCGLVSIDDARKFSNIWPQLDRDLGAGILEYVRTHPGAELLDRRNFAADSLFCEWAYVIDLDHDMLEVYRGFNHDPLTESDRFFDLTAPDTNDAYEPIKLWRTIPLADVVKSTPIELDQQIDQEEEE